MNRRVVAYYLALLPATVLIFELISSQDSEGQQIAINFTKVFVDAGICNQLMRPHCDPIIDVVYENQSTLVIRPASHITFQVDSIWKGVAEAKKFGYKIDAVDRDTEGKVLVVMSK